MSNVMEKINKNANDIIEDNNFLLAAFENRLIIRIVHIFEKYKIPINKTIIKKNLEENMINNMYDLNNEIIQKYVKLLYNYEKIITSYVNNNTDSSIIKNSTIGFIQKIKSKSLINNKIANNFIEYINSIIYVYDNNNLNMEVLNRINTDISEIINEFNRNNYNFVISSINDIIKNIISQM